MNLKKQLVSPRNPLTNPGGRDQESLYVSNLFGILCDSSFTNDIPQTLKRGINKKHLLGLSIQVNLKPWQEHYHVIHIYQDLCLSEFCCEEVKSSLQFSPAFLRQIFIWVNLNFHLGQGNSHLFYVFLSHGDLPIPWHKIQGGKYDGTYDTV